MIWLTRQLQPDFKTIADCRRENKTAFRQVFREFVVLCRRPDLFGRELIAVDGTRAKAVNSGQRNFTNGKLAKAMAESDARLNPLSSFANNRLSRNGYLARVDEADKDDSTPSARVDNLGVDQIDVVAERGYHRIEDPEPVTRGLTDRRA